MQFPFLLAMALLFLPSLAEAMGDGSQSRTLFGQVGAITFLLLQIICFLLLGKITNSFQSNRSRVIFFLVLIIQYILASVITVSMASIILVPVCSLFILVMFFGFLGYGYKLSFQALYISGVSLIIFNAAFTIFLWMAIDVRYFSVRSVFQEMYRDITNGIATHGNSLTVFASPFDSDPKRMFWWTLVNTLLALTFVRLMHYRSKWKAPNSTE